MKNGSFWPLFVNGEKYRSFVLKTKEFFCTKDENMSTKCWMRDNQEY